MTPELIEKIRNIALSVHRRHVPAAARAQVGLDDLVHEGVRAMLENDCRFAPDRGIEKEGFLLFKARAAMLDMLRKHPLVRLPKSMVLEMNRHEISPITRLDTDHLERQYARTNGYSPSSATPEEKTWHNQISAAVAECLQNITPPRDRLAFIARIIRQEKFTDLAARWQLSPQRTRIICERARKKCSAALPGCLSLRWNKWNKITCKKYRLKKLFISG